MWGPKTISDQKEILSKKHIQLTLIPVLTQNEHLQLTGLWRATGWVVQCPLVPRPPGLIKCELWQTQQSPHILTDFPNFNFLEMYLCLSLTESKLMCHSNTPYRQTPISWALVLTYSERKIRDQRNK